MDPIIAFCWIQFWAWSILSNGLTEVQAAICTYQVCHFDLNVSLFRTMTYRDEAGGLNPVFLNGVELQTNVEGQLRTLSPKDIIVADGFERDVIVFNGQLPGPTIEVMEGAQVCPRIVAYSYTGIILQLLQCCNLFGVT